MPPRAVILDHVLAETFDGLTTHTGDEAAIDFLSWVEGNSQLHTNSLMTDAFATAKGILRRHKRLSFVDACIVAYMQMEGLGYLYAFDDDLDAAESVYRLDIATNPYQSE